MIVFQQLARAFRVGLLASEAVAPVDLRKECSQSERVDDGPRWHDRLVG